MDRNELHEKRNVQKLTPRKEEMYRNEPQEKKKCIEMNHKIRRNVQK